MKLLRTFTILSFSILLFACGDNSAVEANENEAAEEATMKEETTLKNAVDIDLSQYDLAASISIPDESKGKAEVSLTDAGSIVIKVGTNFNLDIQAYGISVAEKKDELASDLVYEIEYIEESENSILYKKSIKDSDITPEYHFFLNKEIDGDIVEVKNGLEEFFSQKAVEKMMQSANSLKANNANPS